MKAKLALAVLAIAACTAREPEFSDARAEFIAIKDLKDRLYAERDDCPRLMNMFSEDVVFWEKGRRMGYDFLVEYCPQLPKAVWQPEESSSERVMLSDNAAYEILTERLIHPQDGSVYMRTTTEVWQQLGNEWKITHMNIGLHQVDSSPLARVEAISLDTANVGRVTAHFAPTDRNYARQLAALTEEAAAYFEHELGASFPLHLAVLSPDDWFDPYPGGDSIPYGMPWGWVENLLMTAPASLDEGVLVSGSDDEANRRRVQFVLLHEFGHLASKQHLHPESSRPYSSVRWFEEFLATYFAYAYVRAHEPEWAEASRREWVDLVGGYTPSVLSLDWSFMRDLPRNEFARTYAWYQNLLNLRVADLYEEQGLDFLRAARAGLAWEDSGEWTTGSLLPVLEEIAHGFEAWADNLQSGVTQEAR